ncbi:MAG: ATP-dependent Clp protease adaptor ClpS [Fimbriimonadaceae bacterium]|nr:ATP-dependent Clp protease adaptor ClpS [Fimbriimonadaceae bacterium]
MKWNTAPGVLPGLEEVAVTKPGPGWIVTVYNNETNTYEEVISILRIATGCTTEEAAIETWEIDHYGLCVVHRAGEDECLGVSKVIATIGIGVEATPDPLA